MWQGHPEIVARRDAYTRHYDLSDGRAVAIVSTQPQNYQDEAGHWLPLDTRFKQVSGGFVVTGNSLHSSLGNTSSVVMLRHDNALVGWEPQQLVPLNAAGMPAGSIAQPHATTNRSPGIQPILSPDGRTLTYTRHWSDPTLSERFQSGPGSLEHSLVLAAPPQPAHSGASVDGATPQWLALEVKLYLLSGETLWVNGQAQTDSFSTVDDHDRQPLEIRNAGGDMVLSLAPVIAYEEANPAHKVNGHYRGKRVEPGVWQLSIVTPWSWWADPSRTYPAVLDPTMYVQSIQPATMTQHHEVDDDPSVLCGIRIGQDEAVKQVQVSAGVILCEVSQGDFERDTQYTDKTDIVFDPLPPLPQVAGITGATLEMKGIALGNDFQIQIVNPANNSVIDTRSLGTSLVKDDCTGAPCSLYDSTGISTTFDFNLPAGKIVPLLQSWYTGQNHGLQIRPLTPQDNNTCNPAYTVADHEDTYYECAFHSISSPQLLIYYTTPTLQAGHKVQNQTIPGYDKTFGRSGHEYKTDTLPQDWTALAVLGDADTNRQVDVPLEALGKVSRKSAADSPSPVNRRVNFVMLDNSTGQLPDTVSALVRESQNNFSPDPISGAVYDIMWQKPHQAALPTPTGTWNSNDRGFGHSDLLAVFPFDLPGGDTLAVRVIAPQSSAIHVELFPPQPGLYDPQSGDELYADWVAGRDSSPNPVPGATSDGKGNLIYNMSGKSFSPVQQRWALAIAHDGANDTCPAPPPGAAAASTDASGCPRVSGYHPNARLPGRPISDLALWLPIADLPSRTGVKRRDPATKRSRRRQHRCHSTPYRPLRCRRCTYL